MMKKISIITICLVMLVFAACDNVRRNPGRAYMPDMAYSRAYETYSSTENLQKKGIRYNGLPVNGTIARGDMLQIYTLPNDSSGYTQSASVKNPLTADSTTVDLKEAERLYLVNCGICHGPKLDGNGPLWNDGNGPYLAAPKNLMSDELKKMADGTYFHSITYGKGQMGSYAAQLNTMQRWMVIAYIRTKQGTAATGAPAATADSATTKTTTGAPTTMPKQP